MAFASNAAALSDPTSATSAANAAFAGVSSPHYDTQVGSALKSLIDQYGVGLLGEPGRLRGLLQDECPRAKREMSVLLHALEERVPQDLLRVHSGEPIRSLTPRLTKRLMDEKAMSPDASRWAVSTWSQGLGLVVPSDMPGEAAARSGDALATQREWSAASIGPQSQPRSQPVQFESHDTLESEPQCLDPLPVKRFPVGQLVAGVAAIALCMAGWSAFMRPKIEIAGVEATVPLVANGKPLPVQLSFQARNAAPKEVEVRFVRGDGNWNPAPTVVPVGAAAESEPGRVPAGSFSYKSLKPASVTFAYTLVTKDGLRSAPFERTFDIAPPVTISEVTVPRGLQVNQAFVVSIKYVKGASDIVQIQRRVVESNGNWADNNLVQPVKHTADSGSFDYRFEPFKQPLNSTIEFTLIDAQGLRSEPVRVAINIAAVPAPAPIPTPSTLPVNPWANGKLPTLRGLTGMVLSVREVQVPGQSTGVGAVAAGVLGGLAGRQTGRGIGRDIMTGLGIAGGAFAGNEIEKNVRATTTWETTVRLDTGEQRVIASTMAPTWRAGDRVGIDGRTIVGRR